MTVSELPSVTGANGVIQLEMMPKAPDERAAEQPMAGVAKSLQDRLRSGRSNCHVRFTTLVFTRQP